MLMVTAFFFSLDTREILDCTLYGVPGSECALAAHATNNCCLEHVVDSMTRQSVPGTTLAWLQSRTLCVKSSVLFATWDV